MPPAVFELFASEQSDCIITIICLSSADMPMLRIIHRFFATMSEKDTFFYVLQKHGGPGGKYGSTAAKRGPDTCVSGLFCVDAAENDIDRTSVLMANVCFIPSAG